MKNQNDYVPQVSSWGIMLSKKKKKKKFMKLNTYIMITFL